MRLARNAILALLVLPDVGRVTSAHPIVIHNGEISWDQKGLRISLTFDEHTLQHEIDAIGGGATPEEVTRMLAESIEIIAHDRGRIAPTQCDESTDAYRLLCIYDIPANAPAVALLHRPTDRTALLPRQFQLAWRSPTDESTRIIRLTSRGNHAVLLRDGSTDAGILVDAFNEPVIRLSAMDESDAEIQIDYPLTILATWPDLLSVDEDMLTTKQFERTRSAVAAWANERLKVDGPDGILLPLTASKAFLLDPSGAAIDCADSRPYSIYTTRVRIRFLFEQPTPRASMSVTWNGFNAAILRVPVLYRDGAAEALIGLVSPSQPSLKVERFAK